MYIYYHIYLHVYLHTCVLKRTTGDWKTSEAIVSDMLAANVPPTQVCTNMNI